MEMRKRRVKSLFLILSLPPFSSKAVIQATQRDSTIYRPKIILKERNTSPCPFFKVLANFCPYSQIIELS